MRGLRVEKLLQRMEREGCLWDGRRSEEHVPYTSDGLPICRRHGLGAASGAWL